VLGQERAHRLLDPSVSLRLSTLLRMTRGPRRRQPEEREYRRDDRQA